MIRSLLAVLCLSSVAFAQPNFAPANAVPVDPEVLKQIEAKTITLREAFAALPKETSTARKADVEIYLKAAEWIVRHGEYFTKDSGKQTLLALDAGLARAKAVAAGKAPWLELRGKPMIRGYYSTIDRSVQPFKVTLPVGYTAENAKTHRLDVVLHGRDQTLTEVKFIASAENAKVAVKGPDYIVLEPYGRGNNAYRWAGEVDVFESAQNLGEKAFDTTKVVLRGFSMGGAGTWHIGLHNPFSCAVIGPGAGFTTTRGYIKNLPAKLPDYQEACLHIYDAVDYAENAFNVPIVAYSGEIDPQKAAADNIENALKAIPNFPKNMTHIVAPGLEHKQPPEWLAKCDDEYRKHLMKPRGWPEKIHFVTYTLRYNIASWARIEALDAHYERAVLDGTWTKTELELTTKNIRRLRLFGRKAAGYLLPATAKIDGQEISFVDSKYGGLLHKVGGKWASIDSDFGSEKLEKIPEMQGPIDDAFMTEFVVFPSTGKGWTQEADAFATARLNQFRSEWDKFFRGKFSETPVARGGLESRNVVLFGDPASNPHIAEAMVYLPITWTKDTLVVNGKTYDPKTHFPAMIYPNKEIPNRYIVINSGHSFHAAELTGTNAQLYPRLGDWAVLKPKPTKADPAAVEVVDAGLFDERWQFVQAKPASLPTFLAPDAKLELLWNEGEFTEGTTPGPDGCIYFSDIGNRVMKYDPATNKTTTFRDPGGRTNGLKFDAEGRLLACEGANIGGNRRISITDRNGKVTTLADAWNGKKFNSPNDLTIDGSGRVYFTDPRYVGEEKREIDTESVYRIDTDGKVTQIISDVEKPNGIAISPDGKTLYLAVTNGDAKKQRLLLAYPLNADGSVGKQKLLYDFGADRGIDGMAIAADGTIVATAGKKDTAGVAFFAPDGKKIGFLPVPEDTNNCCFAGADKKTLYIAAGKSLYRAKLSIAGK